jgi:hypothetical protein
MKKLLQLATLFLATAAGAAVLPVDQWSTPERRAFVDSLTLNASTNMSTIPPTDEGPIWCLNPWDLLPTNYTEDQWLSYVTNQVTFKQYGKQWVALGENSYYLDKNYWPQSTNTIPHGIKYLVDTAHYFGFKVFFGFSVFHGLPVTLGSHSSHPDKDSGWRNVAIWAITNGFDKVSVDSISQQDGGESQETLSHEAKLFSGYLQSEAARLGLPCPPMEPNAQHNSTGWQPDYPSFATSWGTPNLVGQDYITSKENEYQLVTNIYDPIVNVAASIRRGFYPKPFIQIAPWISDALGMVTNEPVMDRNLQLSAMAHSSIEENYHPIYPGLTNAYLRTIDWDDLASGPRPVHSRSVDPYGGELLRTRLSQGRWAVTIWNRSGSNVSFSLPVVDLFTGPYVSAFDCKTRSSIGLQTNLSVTLPYTLAQTWILTPIDGVPAVNAAGLSLSRQLVCSTNTLIISGSTLDSSANGSYVWDSVGLQYSNTTTAGRWFKWWTQSQFNVLPQWYVTASNASVDLTTATMGLSAPALDYRDIRRLAMAGSAAGWVWSNGTAVAGFTVTLPSSVTNAYEASVQDGAPALPVVMADQRNIFGGTLAGTVVYPWNTTNLPGYASTPCILWYRPSVSGAITNAGATAVTVATDLTGLGNHGQNTAAKSTWPTYGNLNGLLTAKCDGTSQYFGSSTFTNNHTSTAGSEYAFLMRYNAATNGNIRIIMDSFSTSFRTVFGQNGGSGSSGQFQLFVSGGASQILGCNLPVNTWIYVDNIFAGANSLIGTNGLTNTVAGSTDFGGQSGIILGDYGGHGFCAPIEIADLAVFHPPLTGLARIARFQEICRTFGVDPVPILIGSSPTSFTNFFGANIEVGLSGQGTSGSVTVNGNTWLTSMGTAPGVLSLRPGDWYTFTYGSGSPVGQWRFIP